MGKLDILKAGSGHNTLTFDDDTSVEDAESMIQTMLQQGYLITVKDGDQEKKVTGYDTAHKEYIINKGESRAPVRESEATAVAPPAGG